jgi:hypothetical protein
VKNDPLFAAQKLLNTKAVGRPLLRALCARIGELENDLTSRNAIELSLRNSLCAIEQMAHRAFENTK